MKNRKYLLTLILCLICSVAFAQQKRISGHVWSKADGAIMMANVVEKDKNGRIVSATQTDMSGNFTLTIKNPANVLEISYIGYAKYSKTIGAQTSFRVQLEDRHTLTEAKVTQMRKTKSNGLTIPERELSSATQSLDMENMEGLSFETAGEALQGQIAGLDIVANSGNLGSGTSMRLRGTSSINGNQEPLIVVDGYPMEELSTDGLDLTDMENEEQFANLLQVAPDDIKKINVLKDGASTVQYGSQGANGVIEIYTKRGARGKTKVNFSYKFTGAWQPQGRKLLNGDGYTMMLKEAYFNPHQSDAASGIVELMYLKDHPAYYGNFNKNTDWVDEVTQFGQTHNVGVNISGGGEKASFRVSGTYDHETGTIIQQSLDRLTTRLALDYYVSDRITFRSNFALTYTKNNMNYADILAKAYAAMPNMAITRQEYDNINDTYYDSGEYFLMPKPAAAAGLLDNQSGLSSFYLGDMVRNGNPVAIANLAKRRRSTYNINPTFDIDYKFLGKEDDEWQLNYTGSVNISANTQSNDGYFPAALSFNDWSSGINEVSSSESKGFAFTTRHDLVLKPAFFNPGHSLQVLARYELKTDNTTSQSSSTVGVNGGIKDPTVPGFLNSISSSTGKSRRINLMATAHYAFGSRYILDATVRSEGSTNFGSSRKWNLYLGFSGRWNISDEKFFQPLRNVVSMLAIRGGWARVGNPVTGSGLSYNKYSPYGSYNGVQGIYPSSLRLVEIRPEKKYSWNLGANLSFLDNLINFDFNVYDDRVKDQIMGGVRIPTSTGYASLGSCNIGELENKGWELNISTGHIFKLAGGKFYAVLRANFAQNINTINEMDASVLNNMNSDFNYSGGNQQVLSRVQIGNALGGIYGFHFKGVYVYDYDHNGYFDPASGKNNYYDANGVENTAAHALANGYGGVNIYNAAPVARDAEGKVIYDKSGNPLPMIYNYGGVNYQFSGGDVAYEDINHDGQINELDIQYLGSSSPKFNGGFGVDLTYGRWTLKTNFNFRVGNKIINVARLRSESMRDNQNQSAAVNWRWRKNGQVTEIPRALSTNIADSYNALISDRYVEKGDYLRFQYLQLGYSMDPKLLKKAGLSQVRFTASINNLFVWSKYTGADPDHPTSGYNPCTDYDTTPRSRSFTAGVQFGF